MFYIKNIDYIKYFTFFSFPIKNKFFYSKRKSKFLIIKSPKNFKSSKSIFYFRKYKQHWIFNYNVKKNLNIVNNLLFYKKFNINLYGNINKIYISNIINIINNEK